MYEVKLIGTGSYVPDNIVTNEYLSSFLDTTDEWISTRTGILNRRISNGITTAQLGKEAALRAINSAMIKPEDIDLIIVATMTADNYLPNTACEIQKLIGASNAACFDINAACTGFVYALNVATQFIMTGNSKIALVIGAEVISKLLDWTDRTTSVLFGDGAGAVVISRSENKGIIKTVMHSDGNLGDSLTCKARPIINKYYEENNVIDYMKMDGQEIFKFVCTKVPESIKEVLENTEYEINDIKQLVLHQANKRIIEAVAKRIKVDINKCYMNLQEYGNTSAASIPIALDEVIRKKIIIDGDPFIISGFGGGLTWGTTLIKL